MGNIGKVYIVIIIIYIPNFSATVENSSGTALFVGPSIQVALTHIMTLLSSSSA
jgi:hypothetical protein